MMFDPIKKVNVYCSERNETLSVSPDDQTIQLPAKYTKLHKAFDLVRRYNQLMEELISFYEESDHIYFE